MRGCAKGVVLCGGGWSLSHSGRRLGGRLLLPAQPRLPRRPQRLALGPVAGAPPQLLALVRAEAHRAAAAADLEPLPVERGGRAALQAAGRRRRVGAFRCRAHGDGALLYLLWRAAAAARAASPGSNRSTATPTGAACAASAGPRQLLLHWKARKRGPAAALCRTALLQSDYIRHLGGVRRSVPASILCAESCLRPLARAWLLAGRRQWNCMAQAESGIVRAAFL